MAHPLSREYDRLVQLKQPKSLRERLYTIILCAGSTSLVALRFVVNDVRKNEFDQAILELANNFRLVQLQSHDHPYGMNEDDRDRLVYDSKHDIYYVGVVPI